MSDRITQMRRGVVELAILALLQRESLYGGAIVERLSSYRGLSASAGTVYPLLSRLHTSGALTTRWEESPSGPPRKYYSLTAQGRRDLAAMRQVWATLSTDLTTILEEQ